MRTNMLCKLIIDLVMTVLFLLAMACFLTGDAIHEVLGVSLLLLIVMHNIVNWRWYGALLTGPYHARRVFQTAVNLLLLITVLVLPVSGIMLSRSLFAFMDLNGGLFARKLHILSAYWGFILMSVHLGIHWEMVLTTTQQLMKLKTPVRSYILLSKAWVVLVVVYGIYASFSREIGAKLILYYTYDFADFDQSPVFFFLDYFSIMGLCIYATYYTVKRMRQSSSKNAIMKQ